MNLPARLLAPLTESLSTLALHLSWRTADGVEREAYVAWGGGSSLRDCLEVPAAVVEALNMKLPLRVNLKAVTPPAAERVSLVAETAADWELVQDEAVALESEILLQTNVVAAGQVRLLATGPSV